MFQIGDKYNMRSKSEELMLRIREYIESYFERYSSTPTVREIAGAMKIAVSSAHRYLVAMAEKDMVFYENGTLSTPKIRRMNPAVSPAAIVASIPCGSPEEKEAQEDEALRAGHRAEHAEVISYDECRADFDVRRYAHGATPADVLIFHAPDASPDTRGISHVLSWFEAHPETVIAYADEDEIDEAGKRKNPWLKPDWSPDTLMSCFYFGGFFAVRRQAMENCPWLADENPLRNLYDLVLRLTEIENGTAHIDSVLFHHEKIEVWGMEETYDDLKKAAYVRRGWPLTTSGKVSIIIPTKDHPHILSN